MDDSHQTHIARELLINLASAWQTIEPGSLLGNSLGKLNHFMRENNRIYQAKSQQSWNLVGTRQMTGEWGLNDFPRRQYLASKIHYLNTKFKWNVVRNDFRRRLQIHLFVRVRQIHQFSLETIHRMNLINFPKRSAILFLCNHSLQIDISLAPW